MAYCLSRPDFAAGWPDAGNRRAFEAMAAESELPVGLLAYDHGEPVGWLACGPRSRYAVATSTRSKIMRARRPEEDDSVWLVPCLFVRVGHRRKGITYALLEAAIQLARSSGAVAVEGWPRSGDDRRQSDLYLGREKLFAALGFTCIDRPSAQRAVMRLELRQPEAQVG
jgi:GNAT superfamily N-acetyltransferase